MQRVGALAPTSQLSLKVIRGGQLQTPWPCHELSYDEIRKHGLPQNDLPQEVQDWRLSNVRNLMRGATRVLLAKQMAKVIQMPYMYGSLYLTKITGSGERINLGLVSMRVVTDTGVGYIVDAFQNLTELENMKYHGFGTGTTAEAATQSALITELTTQYAPDSTRPTGSTTENAANIFRTVATFSPDTGGTIAVTEHGIFSQAATGGGVMLDRSTFSAVNVVAGSDSIQSTYDLTVPSGG